MRNVVVTGGSRGLGLGICRRLARAGYQVLAIARTETDQIAAEIKQVNCENGGAIRFIAFDLGEIEEIGKLVKCLRKDFGPFYGLINNAGISFDGTLALMQNAQIERLIKMNTVSPIVLTKYVLRAMMSDGGPGRIVNISSIIGSTGYSGLSVYGASKASLLGFTRSLAREVGRAGINVNAVAPGFLDTEMTREMTEEQRQRIARRSALRQFAEVDDVASTVEFLLSNGAKSITGTVLTVDAGNTA